MSQVKIEQPQRRSFSPEYKLKILQEIDQRKESEGKGVIGEILRREALYASQVALWRKQLEEVITNGIPNKKRGPKADPTLELKKKLEQRDRQLARAQEELRQARLIIEAQRKLAEAYTPKEDLFPGLMSDDEF